MYTIVGASNAPAHKALQLQKQLAVACIKLKLQEPEILNEKPA